MRLPTIRGTIDRRILVNYRIAPEILSRVLPEPFRPMTVNGFGIAGICLIRLRQIRPRFLPKCVGLSSENAAHRIAVEWDQNGIRREGVYIPRRDTSLRLNALAGGRLFPGVHHMARFEVDERDDSYRIRIKSNDGMNNIAVEGKLATSLPDTSIFSSLEDVSDFFEAGSLGYSSAHRSGEFDGLELRTLNWKVAPLQLTHVRSSFFDNQDLFPAGSVELDCGLLMQRVEHEWHSRGTLRGSIRHRSPATTHQSNEINRRQFS